MDENNLFENEFDRQYGDSYRESKSSATNPDHQLPGNSETDCGQSSTTPPHEDASSAEAARELAAQVKPKDWESVEVMGYAVQDIINTMLPNGAPEGSRHRSALKLCYDLLIILGGNHEKARQVLEQQKWVQDIINERGMAEIDRIVESARKLLHKRESENFNDPQPSKEMRSAIKELTGVDYSALIREEQSHAAAQYKAMQADILQTLERIGKELQKLAPQYPLLRLLLFRIKLKYFIAAFFLGGAFAINLLTRCWYRWYGKPGKKCRLNSLVLLIGRMGGGKQIAVDFYKLMMEPIKKADAAQISALNNWNKEKDQNNGGQKNKTPRPAGIYRALPSETSTAALREAEANAHEMLDGEDFYLHVSIFDSELQNTLAQMKKSHMDAFLTYWLKSFHNEPHGAYLKTSSAPVGETDVHFNAVYTGTDAALDQLNSENNNVNGLMSRFTIVPNADSNFEMMQVHDYDEAAQKRDAELLEWAYRLDSCKGEIPCKMLSDTLHQWTARRMADAGEDQDYAQEDLVKRPNWHSANFSIPYIISRHWDQMVLDDDGHWMCGPDFKVDKTDVRLALLIAKAQLAFQEYYCKPILEKYYDNKATKQASSVRHQQRTLLAYRRLPNPFTSEDVKREYGYDSTGSVCSRLKHLCDDGMARKIRKGPDKGKYQKTTA
jgi:hypothetical protein